VVAVEEGKDAPRELMGNGKKESQALRPSRTTPARCARGATRTFPSATR
jgi:hypothetical protein